MVFGLKQNYVVFPLRNLKGLFPYLVCLTSENECLECSRVERTCEVKYLGVHLDSSLLWKFHISKSRKKSKSAIKSLYFLKKNYSYGDA